MRKNKKRILSAVLVLLLLALSILPGCAMENIGDVGTVATDTVSTTEDQ